MSDSLSRREFAVVVGSAAVATVAEGADPAKPAEVAKPVEAPFERDYDAPKFAPGWKKPQINRLLVQDFVIYGHMDLPMVKKLLEKEPALLNAAMDWGAGDWETALGGASHLGNHEIAEFLIEKGARVDLFAATMLGQLEVVKALLTLQPKLIDAKGPHGFTLHWHAKMGGKLAETTLEYLQSVKKVEFPAPPPKKKD